MKARGLFTSEGGWGLKRERERGGGGGEGRGRQTALTGGTLLANSHFQYQLSTLSLLLNTLTH